MAITVSDKRIKEILRENGTSKYHITYNDHQANHLAHAVVAMQRLGASEERISQFLEWFVQYIEPPDGKTASQQQSAERDIAKLLGARKNYYLLLNHYQDVLNRNYGSDLEAFIREEFHKLIDGIGGAAFHGLIQMAYGFTVNSPGTVCEGIAYLHHDYVPLNLTRDLTCVGTGTRDILDVLENLRQERPLKNYMLEVRTSYKSASSFLCRFCPMLMNKADDFLEYARQVRFPSSYDVSTLDGVMELCKWVMESAVVAYAKAEKRNDFFLPHGVTLGWSLLKILETYKDVNKALDVVRLYLLFLLIVYLCRDSPELVHPIDESCLKFKDWGSIINRVLTFQPDIHDEHIYKLVQCVFDLANSDNNNNQQRDLVCRAAANVALVYHLSISSGTTERKDIA